MDNDQNKIIQPVHFNQKNTKQKPIHFMDQDPNGSTRYAILKTTDNGKWIRGNMLYYSLHGVEIYTELNNVIFVDEANSTLFVREYEKVIKEIDPEKPEEKQYIILYTDLGYTETNEEFPLRWEAYTGRQKAYEAIKLNAPVIDIDSSIVLVETAPLKDALTVRAFVNYLQNASLVKEDNFDINNFAGDRFV